MDGTIHDLFSKTAVRCRDNIAFNYFNVTWKVVTYEEFHAHSRAVASYLINSGINKSDRIAIISENRPEWCISFMGIVMAGGIAVPIDSQMNPEAIANLLADSGTRLIFHSSKTEGNVREAIKSPHGITQVNFDSPDFEDICKIKKDIRFSETDIEDTASIIYTSGTTGIPKGVVLTHRNFCSDAEAIIKANVVTERDNVLSILPLHHTYPFMCTFLVPIFLGATITFSPSLKGTDIITSIRDKSVTILIGVPQLLELIRNGIINKLRQLPFPLSWMMRNILRLCSRLRRTVDINIGKIIFRSAHNALGRQFKFFGSGGAKLDPDIMKDLEAIGFTVLEGYGLTETSPVVTFNPIRERRLGSAGKPLPLVEIRINEPETGRILGPNKEGEIVIKGHMVMKGYYKNPEATAQVIKDGWFFSGDLGYVDDSGYIFITGRIKEVIVLSSGKNVYPEEVEKEYLKSPLIKEICVIPLPPPSESLHAIVVPDMDYARQQRIGNVREALGWEIIKVSSRLSSFQRIKGFTIHPDPLPRTPLGKLRRFMIKDLLKVQSPKSKIQSEDYELISDDIGKRVVGCIKPLLREDAPIQSVDNLELDLGLDSLQRIELVVSLEKEFSVKLPDTFASDIHTVGEIVEKIKGAAVREQGPVTPLSPPLIRGELKGGVLSQEPSDGEKKNIGLRQGIVEWFFVSSLIVIAKLFFRIFFRLEVKGIGNIPQAPFIIASNHSSYLDGFIIGAGVPVSTFRQLYFLGFQKYFRGKFTAFFARLAHVIPIDPETYLNKALQLSAYVLKNNKTLSVFPEGGRSPDGNIMEFKKGIGILAIELGIPVIPAVIEGSFEALPRGSYVLRFKKIKLTIGKPFYPSDLDMNMKSEDIDKYQFFADEIRQRVKELLQ
ncbi:MAG: AMP-binding protein [Nitrospirae bacterium]|nr:AMP-binding protein [Nitrospirota bacterium]